MIDNKLIVDNVFMKLYLTILGLLIFLNFACQSSQDFTSNNQDFSDIPDQESFDATLTTTRNGELSTVIHYGEMKKFSNKKLVHFLNGVNIEIYEDGKLVSNINSKSAVLNENSKEFELKENVRVKSNDGISMFTERLLWNENKNKVTSNTFVTVITAENDTINGTGFESEKSFKKWLILKPYGVTQKKLNIGLRDDKEE